MTLYKLVNPLIKGKLNTTFEANSSGRAAEKAYNSISKYFHNSTPEFLFTLQKVRSKNTQVGEGKVSDYLHFKVIENRSGNQVNFELIPYKNFNKKRLNKFKKSIRNTLDENIQSGGGYRDRYDINLDEDDDRYLYKSDTSLRYEPISLWLYDPYIYSIDRLYVPTFVSSISPYVTYLLHDYPYFYR